ncbi:MAG: hypothetical protein SEPTF4163_005495 [Sporothrix epigloea]
MTKERLPSYRENAESTAREQQDNKALWQKLNKSPRPYEHYLAEYEGSEEEEGRGEEEDADSSSDEGGVADAFWAAAYDRSSQVLTTLADQRMSHALNPPTQQVQPEPDENIPLIAWSRYTDDGFMGIVIDKSRSERRSGVATVIAWKTTSPISRADLAGTDDTLSPTPKRTFTSPRVLSSSAISGRIRWSALNCASPAVE